MKYRKILLAYNGSHEGKRALLECADLASFLGAQTHLLAVASMPPSLFLTEGFVPEELLEEEKKRTQAILDEGIRTRTSFRSTRPPCSPSPASSRSSPAKTFAPRSSHCPARCRSRVAAAWSSSTQAARRSRRAVCASPASPWRWSSRKAPQPLRMQPSSSTSNTATARR